MRAALLFHLLLVMPGVARSAPPDRVLPPGTIVHRDLAYVEGGHVRQKLDLYLPAAGDKVPLIIHIHGGAFRAGDKADGVPVGYTGKGCAVASLNYRLSQDAVFPAQIEDCKAAVRWLRAHAGEYRLDPGRFAAWGASAGGHLAAMLGTTGDAKVFETGAHADQSSAVCAVVDWFGPTDFLQMDAHRVAEGMLHDPADSPESQLVGGAIQRNREAVAKANPITYISKGDPPVLICHGDSDPLVPHHQSGIFGEALRKAGVPVIFHTVKGGGHGGFSDPEVPRLTEDFLAEHLEFGPAAGSPPPATGVDPASLTPGEQAAKLGIKLPNLPWHVADLWWDFEKPVGKFESLDMDVTLDRDLPADVNLYVSPVGIARINSMDFYGGLQTNINGWAGKESRERVHPGRGAIFSRWSNDKNTPIGLHHVRMAADGLCESAGYEGEFCSVRRPFAWGKGTYTYSIVKGDTETVDGHSHTWFHCVVRSHADQMNHVVGSLRFEGTEFTYWARHSAFVEIYSTERIPRSKIPRVTVTFGYPRINGAKPPPKRTVVNYNASGEAAAPACAKARADGENIVVEVGPIFQRSGKEGQAELKVIPRP